MLTKKTTIILAAIVISTIGVATAKNCDDFSQADYNRVLKGEKNFAGVKLEGANFKGMDLTGVDFKGADLEKANFEKANLTNASFQKADLEEANLKGANIKGAIFSGAEMEFTTWVDGRVCAEDSVGGCW